jgi:peptidyl-prolyl cis-trans isomerase SurA
MSRLRTTRFACLPASRQCLPFALVLFCAAPVTGQDAQLASGSGNAVTLDRVVAVVNRETILMSDVEDEMQLSVLDPDTKGQVKESEADALQHLISRALIQQQIQQENLQGAEPTPQEVSARIEEIRTELPACIREDCKSDAGWKAFLSHYDLSPARVQTYVRNRLEILSFIELRFRQGIRITPEEIETYYRETLLPQYPSGQAPPSLQQVSSRIEEILLQQRVNALFETWLANLRSQGQIEIVDPALESASASAGEGATKE